MYSVLNHSLAIDGPSGLDPSIDMTMQAHSNRVDLPRAEDLIRSSLFSDLLQAIGEELGLSPPDIVMLSLVEDLKVVGVAIGVLELVDRDAEVGCEELVEGLLAVTHLILIIAINSFRTPLIKSI